MPGNATTVDNTNSTGTPLATSWPTTSATLYQHFMANFGEGDFVLDPRDVVVGAFEEEPAKPEKNPDKKFINHIGNLIDTGQWDEISEEDQKRYNDLVRKKRHLRRDERRAFHRPEGDGLKTTSAIVVDDIAP